MQIGLEDVAEGRGDAARDEGSAPARRRRAQRPGGKTVNVQCDGSGREPEAVKRHRAAQVAGMPAEVQHRGVEPRAGGPRAARAVHVAVEAQLREAAGREFQPLLAVGMRSAHIDIVAAQQAGAFRLQGMIHQASGVVISRAIEARHLHHGLVLQQRRPLDAEKRVRHPAVDVVGAVREHGQLRIDRTLVGAELRPQRESWLVGIKPRLMAHPQRHAPADDQIADAVVGDAVPLASEAVGQRGGEGVDPAARHQRILQRLIDGGDELRPADGLVRRHRQSDDVVRRHAALVRIVAGEAHGVGLARIREHHHALRQVAVVRGQPGRGAQHGKGEAGNGQPSVITEHRTNVEEAGWFSRSVSPGLLFPLAPSY